MAVRVAIAAVIAVLVGAAFLLVRGGADVHQDGAGSLGSVGAPGYESLAVDPASGARSWTYGLRLCVMDPASPATIESVGPHASVGTGYSLLGVRIRSFGLTEDHPNIIGVEGYPPPTKDVPDPLTDAVGFTVTSLCADGPGKPYTELLVGLGYATSDGGGWRGIDIGYTSGGRHHVVQLDHDLLVCGSSVAAQCTESTSPSPT